MISVLTRGRMLSFSGFLVFPAVEDAYPHHNRDIGFDETACPMGDYPHPKPS